MEKKLSFFQLFEIFGIGKEGEGEEERYAIYWRNDGWKDQ